MSKTRHVPLLRTKVTPLIHEVGGACGDLGTFIPHVIGAMTVAGLAPAGVLFGFGVFLISTGLFYGLPLPVQPRKAVSAGILTDGLDSTVKSTRTLFPGARLGNCLRHAINKLPKKLTAIGSPVRKALRIQFHALLHRVRQRKSLTFPCLC